MRKPLIVAVALATVATPALAKFDCGRVARARAGLPPSYNLALKWLDQPHTNLHAGAYVVSYRKGRALGGGPGGHVAYINSVIDQCRAIVTDEKGTYERNTCVNLAAYVQPQGGYTDEYMANRRGDSHLRRGHRHRVASR